MVEIHVPVLGKVPLMGNNIRLTLTPHFKPDTENSYVSRENHRMIYCWFNPGKVETLLNVIEHIEDWVVKEFEEKNMDIQYCYSGNYTFTVQYLEEQGTRYYRQEMSTLDAVTVLHDKQPINMIATAHASCYTAGTCCTII